MPRKRQHPDMPSDEESQASQFLHESPGDLAPMDYPSTPAEQQAEEQAQAYRRHVQRRRAHLSAHITEETIQYLEEEFQTNLPCFQTRDPYTRQPLEPNPLTAAIRDGQREVILWLRHELAMHRAGQSSPE